VISQNATFAGVVPQDPELGHPLGAWLAKHLAMEIGAAGWTTSRLVNWRDCGWSLRCSQAKVRLQVIVAATSVGTWMLQVTLFNSPGVIQRSIGARPSATPTDILALSNIVHDILAKCPHIRDIKWRRDVPPDEKGSSLRPSVD